ncbi:SURF1 family protein [Aliiroseovarius sp. YM-037]|uniref:SURF1 family protein n=1 Tax=Aliiroseovarius sp. YM-037 TaxID=3341728 RepID=UPI003A8104CB
MERRIILPLLFGLLGAAVLIGLGVWQVQRLQWKEGVLATIEERLNDAPMTLQDATDPKYLDYAPVELAGRFTGKELHVLASLKRIGAIYRIVSAFETDSGQRILVDRGYVLADQKDAPRPPVEATIIGNLHQPEEVDSFTPPPDLDANIWYARDPVAMAEALGTHWLFVIASDTSEDPAPVTPLPVDTSVIPNDHLGYAITWFSLAVVWLGMTAAIVWRIRRRTQ